MSKEKKGFGAIKVRGQKMETFTYPSKKTKVVTVKAWTYGSDELEKPLKGIVPHIVATKEEAEYLRYKGGMMPPEIVIPVTVTYKLPPKSKLR